MPTGEITAAVPHMPHSTKAPLATSSKVTGRSTTVMPSISRATCTRLRRVMEGRMESVADCGTTIVPSRSTNMKLAPPDSST